MHVYVLSLMLTTLSAFAEQAPVGYYGPNSYPQPNPGAYPSNGPAGAPAAANSQTPSSWNNQVFDLKGGSEPGPATSKSPNSGAERFVESAPDWNSEQEARWKENCKKFKGNDMPAYRQCYNDQRERDRQALRENRNAVERNQGQRADGVEALVEQQRGASGVDRSDSD